MEKTPICRCSLTSLISLIVLVLFPLMSECKVDTYTSRKEATPECCRVRGDAGLKKSKDVDYDSFVGLMGRSAAHPNRRMAHTLTDVFGRITGKACPCPRRYLPTRSDKYALRFQRFV
ncbi:hypothetical protein PBY51_013041 [Eleginops maclovinus]|uniref:Neuromedin-K n=1 Tax=Eleginops maclovinus TaxID=56733 RepID=A0AAN7Y911_ELEMC|nr:hypothetical protein PBY51_013041 [Eleginops maclovinus]